jgi:hypothetical protein
LSSWGFGTICLFQAAEPPVSHDNKHIDELQGKSADFLNAEVSDACN